MRELVEVKNSRSNRSEKDGPTFAVKLGVKFRSAIATRPQLSSCRSSADLRIVNVDQNPQMMLYAFRITQRPPAFPVYDMARRPSVCVWSKSIRRVVGPAYLLELCDVPVENA